MHNALKSWGNLSTAAEIILLNQQRLIVPRSEYSGNPSMNTVVTAGSPGNRRRVDWSAPLNRFRSGSTGTASREPFQHPQIHFHSDHRIPCNLRCSATALRIRESVAGADSSADRRLHHHRVAGWRFFRQHTRSSQTSSRHQAASSKVLQKGVWELKASATSSRCFLKTELTIWCPCTRPNPCKEGIVRVSPSHGRHDENTERQSWHSASFHGRHR